MHTRDIAQELTLNKDLYTCPISLLLIRYPVIASDGRIYELEMFLNVIKEDIDRISPCTRAPLTSFIYSPVLQTYVDGIADSTNIERYGDYDRNAALTELETLFQVAAHQPPQLESLPQVTPHQPPQIEPFSPGVALIALSLSCLTVFILNSLGFLSLPDVSSVPITNTTESFEPDNNDKHALAIVYFLMLANMLKNRLTPKLNVFSIFSGSSREGGDLPMEHNEVGVGMSAEDARYRFE